MKVTVVGAGAVGATCADNIARKELAQELVLLDIKEGLAEGKAQDMMQTAALLGFDTKITGSTNDYTKTAGSDVVIITSGLPRKPGMTREELIGTNAGIVKGVTENILKNSPNAIIIIISNPMDTMTYLTLTTSGLPKNKIIGMGGTLDSARFKYQLSQHLNCSASDLNAIVVGGHGDTTMIPLISIATLYFRYKKLDPRIAPSIISDILLWIAAIMISSVAFYSVYVQIEGFIKTIGGAS